MVRGRPAGAGAGDLAGGGADGGCTAQSWGWSRPLCIRRGRSRGGGPMGGRLARPRGARSAPLARAPAPRGALFTSWGLFKTAPLGSSPCGSGYDSLRAPPPPLDRAHRHVSLRDRLIAEPTCLELKLFPRDYPFYPSPTHNDLYQTKGLWHYAL